MSTTVTTNLSTLSCGETKPERRLRITRYDAGSRPIAQHGCATEEEAVAFLRLAVGHPFGGYTDGKLLEEADPMMIFHLPPPPGAEAKHTLIVDLEPQS